MADIDSAGAAAAIDAAGGLDHLLTTQGDPTATPPSVEPTPVATPQGSPEQAGQPRDDYGRFASPEAQPDATPEPFTNLDPNTLPPELQQVYRNMQADYTRKTQEVAPLRSLQQELGFDDPSQIREAWQLRETIADPQNWPTLYEELGQSLQQMGLTPQQAAAVVQEAQTQPSAGLPDLTALQNDPDLAPLAALIQSQNQQLTETQTRLDQLAGTWEQEREAAQVEQRRAAVFGEMQRQDAAIRGNNPQYEDNDLEIVWEMSTAHNGNLLQAQDRLENYVQYRIGKYVNGKADLSATPSAAIPAGVQVGGQEKVDYGADFDGAAKAARAHLESIGFSLD